MNRSAKGLKVGLKEFLRNLFSSTLVEFLWIAGTFIPIAASYLSFTMARYPDVYRLWEDVDAIGMFFGKLFVEECFMNLRQLSHYAAIMGGMTIGGTFVLVRDMTVEQRQRWYRITVDYHLPDPEEETYEMMQCDYVTQRNERWASFEVEDQTYWKHMMRVQSSDGVWMDMPADLSAGFVYDKYPIEYNGEYVEDSSSDDDDEVVMVVPIVPEPIVEDLTADSNLGNMNIVGVVPSVGIITPDRKRVVSGGESGDVGGARSRRRIVLSRILEIGPSTIVGAGRGVFACVDIKKGSLLCDYLGTIVSREHGHCMAESCDTVMDLGVDHCILGGNIGAAINDNEDKAAINCFPYEYAVHGPARHHELKVSIFASRDILAGEELFMDYGHEYWIGRANLLRASPPRSNQADNFIFER